MSSIKQIFTFVFIILFISSGSSIASEKECFEKTSRAVFKFNQGLDNIVIGPIARGYNKLPAPIRKGTSNFTSNIARLLSVPNHLLQGNISEAGHSIGSFAINTTIGILGFADVATGLGVKDRQEDLSQTLGVYGIKNGCYFVLPVLGPTTVRDTVSMIGDTFLDPFATMTWRQKEVLDEQFAKRHYVYTKGAGAVDFRGKNEKNFENLKINSIDLYSSTKSLYLQNKSKKINNSTSSQDEDWGSLDN